MTDTWATDEFRFLLRQYRQLLCRGTATEFLDEGLSGPESSVVSKR